MSLSTPMFVSLCVMAFVMATTCDAAVTTTTTTAVMKAWIAENSTSQSYTTVFPVPVVGDLHRALRDLPSACEYLIQVMASSINPSDINPPIAVYPHVLGSDVAGIITQVGDGCTQFKVGDAVWGDIGANANTTDGTKTKELGGYSQYTLALETQIYKMPGNVNFTEAGTLPKVSLTSYKALAWYGGATLGHWVGAPTVLILGGSGGTGSAAIQLARAFGAGKIITTTSAVNADYCKSLGADVTIDYHTQNWWDVVADDSVHVVYDTVGQAGTADRALGKIKTGGFFVTIAGRLSNKKKYDVTQSFFINSDTNLNNQGILLSLTTLIENDQLRMKRIAGVYNLQQMPEAFAQSRTHHTVGKVSVDVDATI